MENKNYIEVLKQSLAKKITILDTIISLNTRQKQLLDDPELDPDELDENLNQKADLIEQLNALDDGFEQVYERVSEILVNQRELYKEDIQTMKSAITMITEKSTTIQSQEQRNKKLIQKKFSTVKKQIREVKSSQKAVNQYYNSMMKTNYVDPQFMDNKK